MIIPSEHVFGNNKYLLPNCFAHILKTEAALELTQRKYLNTLQLKMIAPIFAFLVAIGYDKTRNLTMYMGRMFLFALIAQIPYQKMVGLPGVSPNVIFTLFFGLGAILAIEKGNAFIRIFFPIALILGAEILAFDHSAYGVLMVLALYYSKDSKLIASIWIAFLTLLFSLQYFLIGGLENPGWYIVLFYLFTIPLIWMYNGRKGLSNNFTKWFFYIFYPAHIVFLVILKSLI